MLLLSLLAILTLKGGGQGAWRVLHWNFGKPQPLSRSPEKPSMRIQSLDRRASSYTTVSGQSGDSYLLTLSITNHRLDYSIMTTNSIHGNTELRKCPLRLCIFARCHPAAYPQPVAAIHAVNALKLEVHHFGRLSITKQPSNSRLCLKVAQLIFCSSRLSEVDRKWEAIIDKFSRLSLLLRAYDDTESYNGRFVHKHNH